MEEIEKSRKSALRSLIISAVVMTGLSFGIVYGYIYHKIGFIPIWLGTSMIKEVLAPFILASAVAFFGTRFFSSSARDTYRNNYFQKFVRKEFDKEFDNVQADIRGIKEDLVYQANLILSGNTFSSNDRITGTYRGMKFTKADIHMQNERTDSNGNTSTTTYFKGQWIVLEGIEKGIKQLYVVNDKLATPSRTHWFKEGDFEKVQTESIEFNKAFDIHSRSAVDAFYFLTPHMMERFLSYPSKDGFGFSVKGHRAFFAIDSGRDSLEGSLFRPVEQKDFDLVHRDIETIKTTIDVILEAQESDNK